MLQYDVIFVHVLQSFVAITTCTKHSSSPGYRLPDRRGDKKYPGAFFGLERAAAKQSS